MPFVNGQYVRLESWRARQASGANISATEFDADGDDIATALSTTLLRNGTSLPTADLPLNNHTLTGIRAGVANGEAIEYAQWVAGAIGTNKLQNASLNINQRVVSGTVTLTAGQYGHDRWKAGSGGCTYTFASTGADTTITISAGTLMQVVVASDIEGGSYMLSQAGTAQGRAYQGSAPSFVACPVALTGQTVATNTTIEFSTGTILRPQFEPGTVVHAYVRRSYPLDLMACWAFYEKFQYDIQYTLTTGTASVKIPIVYRSPKLLFGTVSPTYTNTFTSNPNSATGNYSTGSDSAIGVSQVIVNSSGSNIQVAGTFTIACEP